MHLNENYLSTKFRDTFGIQIQKLINKKRIIYARNMLLSTNMPVNEISYNSGFKSISQFYRTFKKEFGISPHEYKKMRWIAHHSGKQKGNLLKQFFDLTLCTNIIKKTYFILIVLYVYENTILTKKHINVIIISVVSGCSSVW